MDPAVAGAVAALEDDPFYQSITAAHRDRVRRRTVLGQYFAYSITEGQTIGRCVHLPDRSRGIAVWLLPQPADVRARASHGKRRFLQEALGVAGCSNYDRIVGFMREKAAGLVRPDAWYLSIIAVDPAWQGQGLGGKILEPTLAEADRLSASCYLETFSPKNITFYERLGFLTAAQIAEPTTGASYGVMVRHPRSNSKERGDAALPPCL